MKYILYILSFAFLLTACNNNTEKATEVYNYAVSLYDKGDLNKSKIALDSLKNNFPKEYDLIKESINLMRKIELKENEQTLNYTDSLLKIKINVADSLKNNFEFLKSEYEDKGVYIYKGMNVEKNIERSYLRSGVYEDGDIYLSSVYYGKGNINHTGITLNIPNTETEISTLSVPYDGGTNYRFNDNGNSSEIVTYKKGKDNGAIAFIANNQDKKIKITYTGEKKYITYIDKLSQKSIAESFELASVLSDINRLRQENNIAESKIMYLNNKIKN